MSPTLLSRYYFVPSTNVVFSHNWYCVWVTYSIKSLSAEQGPTCCDRSWCWSNWVGCMAPCSVQEDGNSLLHCQGKSTFGSGNSSQIYVMSFCSIFPRLLELIFIVCFARLFTRKLLQFCAWQQSRMKIKWSSARSWRLSRWVFLWICSDYLQLSEWNTTFADCFV